MTSLWARGGAWKKGMRARCSHAVRFVTSRALDPARACAAGRAGDAPDQNVPPAVIPAESSVKKGAMAHDGPGFDAVQYRFFWCARKITSSAVPTIDPATAPWRGPDGTSR